LRFWDSSALVPLVVSERRSAEVERWRRDDPVAVTWTLTPVEITSALRRLVREGALAKAAAAEAEALAAEVIAGTHVVADVERVKPVATRLLRVHALRAADALQLGAALLWADGSPTGLVVHTFDARLADAAEREGFRPIGHR
jgi:hypothetical protein